MLKDHLKFAVKVFVAVLIINAVIGLAGSAGATIRAFWNNPLGSLNLFSSSSSAPPSA